MNRWWWGMSVALLALPACYSNAQAARESQTMSARGFYCTGEPRVRCPNRGGGPCTGWDTTWTAVCSSDRSEWSCSLDRDGSSRCVQTVAAVPRRAASRPASSSGSAAPGVSSGRRTAGGPAAVRVARDEFTGRTTIEYGAPVEWEDGHRQRADFTVLVNPAPMTGALSITTSHRRWRWLECHALHMLVNGEIVELDESDHDGRVGSGYVVEQVRVPLSRDAIVALTQASEVRVRICNDVMRLSEPSIRVLGEVGPAIAENAADDDTTARAEGGPADSEDADAASESDAESEAPPSAVESDRGSE